MQLIIKNNIFRRLLLSNIISILGDSFYYLALITYASTFDNKNLAISIIAVSELLPQVLSVITGSLADNTKHKIHAMFVIDIFRFILYILVGILIGFNPSFIILIIIALINFVSDIAGGYKGGLYLSIITAAVDKEDIEEANGINLGLSRIVKMCFEFLGAILIAFFTFRELAWVNSAAFLLSGIVIFSMIKTLSIFQDKDNKIEKNNTTEISKIILNIKIGFVSIYKNKKIFNIILFFALLNVVTSTIIPLIFILLAEYDSILIVNFTFSVMIVNITFSLGVIFGSFLGSRVFRKWRLFSLIRLCLIISILIFSSMILKNLIVVLIFLFVLSFLSGSISPKFFSFILSNIDKTKLGSIIGAINTLLLSLTPIAVAIFTSITSINTFFPLFVLVLCSIVILIISTKRIKI